MKIALTLALKDLRLLVRDRLALFWVIGFPLVMAFMFGAMFGGSGGKHDDGAPSGIPVAVVDLERSAASAEFAKTLASSGDLAVSPAADAEAARRDVLAGDAAAYVVLESDFDGPGMLGGKPPRVSIGFAPSRRAEGAMLRGIVMQAGADRLRESFASMGMGGGSGGAMEPVHVESAEVSAKAERDARPHPATNWEITFPSSILWGLIGCAATFAISLVTERQSGTWYRLKTAPLTRAHILLGKGLACFLACAFVLTLLLSIGILGLHVRVQNGPGLVLAAVCAALCFTGLMMFLATLGRTEQAASGMGWGILTLMSMLGGGMFPLFLMPPWMQTVSDVSPVKWGILALEGGIWRGFTLNEMARPCGVLVAVGAAGFAAGSAILARRDR
jgi:linearmycin/streptolysin S transport system permease protein